MLSTSVRGKNVAVPQVEITVLLAKDAIEPVSQAEMKKAFYSPYFIIPKKGGGLRPILDLRVLNQALYKAFVQDSNAETHPLIKIGSQRLT